jgi:hypothetical protein
MAVPEGGRIQESGKRISTLIDRGPVVGRDQLAELGRPAGAFLDEPTVLVFNEQAIGSASGREHLDKGASGLPVG